MIADKCFCTGIRWVIYENGYAGFNWYHNEIEARNMLNRLRQNPKNGKLTLCRVEMKVEEAAK